MSREFKRTDRIGAELQRELAMLIRDEIKDPALGMVTIQEVRVVRDLSQAKTFFTSMAATLSRKESTRYLNQIAGHLRWLLGQRMKLRSIPKLNFVYDTSVEQGEHLSALVEQAVTDNHVDLD
ncbi:MAG: 30S ribosome-binding factor RbfA [Candidatus Thiodiazotropha sp. (ex Lucinoma aequizonata)]|nr:30S ribosome-binding factor RbfA [Candidatus Thiodiazotropha sp. (ex Lucinoma aequizonata)]MCU7887789.1 30S ribosome-binding factor RbfA [Candidatus Thiodiazotropha sp. (ex Lucinoma aequizonata)]MCU7893944.1 30S ribosome-binding factor RbfA [Candidatus Thiodiazotropha sp. (ex Lucinoma aequizonata)]MCU7899320.1 30S ribosome-binding factor RbfA [Candidatus Thiodiazotropha sp. (ex Lucinoma aequizonata)]MCU7903856.1 30S ribosome-binding factor RbfA [Candidatus Thiodiazotropha sp. (ex Lucinoma ae